MVALSGDLKRVALMGTDPKRPGATLLVLDVESKKGLRRATLDAALLRETFLETRAHAAFSRDLERAVVAAPGALAFVDLAAGKETARAKGAVGVHVNDARFSASGGRIAIDDCGTARVFDLAKRKEVRLPGVCGAPRAIAFSADGAQVVSAWSDGHVRVSDSRTGKPIEGSKAPAPAPGALAVLDTTGKVLAHLEDDGSVVAGAHRLPKGRHESVYALALSPDGALVATAGAAPARLVAFAASGKEAFKVDAAPAVGHAVAFSPDGKRVAAAIGEEVVLHDAATGKKRASIPERVEELAFSPDGRRIACVARESASVWDASGARRISGIGGAVV